MDYHPDTNARASKFYHKRGRTGRKMSGGANKTAILRSKVQGELRRWIRLYKKRKGVEPTDGEQRYAVDNPLWLQGQIAALGGNTTVIIKHGGSCECKPCMAERPMGGGTWSEFVDKERARIAEQQRRKQAEIEKQEEEANRAIQEMRQRRSLIADCNIPKDILVNYANGSLKKETLEVIKKVFDTTDDEIREYCWAYGIKVQP